MLLITGGAGYIGSHVNKELHKRGFETLVLDNLTTGHEGFVKWGRIVKADLRDKAALLDVFSKYEIEAVLHFAASAYVGESVENPAKYYENNMISTLNLLDVMLRYNVKKFVFSSSCATYGDIHGAVITEETAQRPINPYGRTKYMIEQVLADYHKAYGLCYCALRYFNAAGADMEAEIGEWHFPETHLIPLLLDVALGKKEYADILGADYPTEDGTCVRDYVHVTDLAMAHILALEYIERNANSDVFNLGYGKGYSVKEIIDIVEGVTEKKLKKMVRNRRDGDPPILVANAEKARNVLHWKSQFSIQEIVESAWLWHMSMYA